MKMTEWRAFLAEYGWYLWGALALAACVFAAVGLYLSWQQVTLLREILALLSGGR